MIETISSLQNPYIKLLRSLKSKKERETHGLFLAEGEKCAWEALEADAAECLLATEESPLTEAAEAQGVRTILCSERVMEAVSDAKNPQGAAAVVKRQALMQQGKELGQLLIALESVADPQNVGTMIRTADAAGAGAVLVSQDTADFTGPKAVRASMGSVFHLPIVVCQDFYGTLAQLRAEGVTLVAGDLAGQGTLAPMKRCCILIGNEARGLTEQALAQADVRYKIPIYGRAESLNAAVAAGILLYQVREGMEK